MIAIENKKGYQANECWVIVDQNGNIVDYKTFSNNRRRSYFYSRDNSIPGIESQFETRELAEKALAKCKRAGQVRKLIFEKTDFSDEYDGQGADILGFDFANSKIWIQSKDKTKYGYEYQNLTMIKP